MKPGSVIVDLAAEQGGNCELTEARRRSSTSTASRSSATPTCRSRMAPHSEPALRHEPRAPARRDGRRRAASRSTRRTTSSAARCRARDGELLWPPPPRSRSPAPLPRTSPRRRAVAAIAAVATNAPKPARRSVTCARRAGEDAISLHVAAAAVAGAALLGVGSGRADRRSSRTSPCSCSPASSAGRSSGT